jgi:hypothetical protein
MIGMKPNKINTSYVCPIPCCSDDMGWSKIGKMIVVECGALLMHGYNNDG